MFADKILNFYKSLYLPSLPDGVTAMNPYRDERALEVCSQFYQKFYRDDNQRRLVIGINPGRFGGGLTGVPFTDPIKLETLCGISNALQKKPELSADFIYKMISAYGGPEKFYRKFYITAVSPLGFIKDGKNLNYYDIRELQTCLTEFIIACFTKQIAFGIDTSTAYCLGEGENFKFISRLNEAHRFFKKIVPLPHPRFIMQYKRKMINEYIAKYLEHLT